MIRPELLAWFMQIAAWGTAFAWCVKTTEGLQNLPSMPNLTGPQWDTDPENMPTLTVVVPARNEGSNITATLDTLVQQDYPNISVIAVDDRSSDDTGPIMDSFAQRFSQRIEVVHVTELPTGWLGKTHAMAQGLVASQSEYVLFTDGDVLFSPSVLRRALVYAEHERADHLVVVPTLQVKTWGEGVMLGYFQVFGSLAARPWKVSDPKSMRDTVGIGAFNLVRRSALAEIGGLLPQRLVILEDIALGRRMKAAGMRQRMAFAPGFVLVHWAAGAMGLVRVMSKNIFSATNFQPALMLSGVLAIALFCLGPLVGLFYLGTLIPGLLVMACIWLTYRLYGEVSGISPKYAIGYPLGVAGFLYAVLRSVVVVWKDGGVRWRGTLYPLRELRRHNRLGQWKAP